MNKIYLKMQRTSTIAVIIMNKKSGMYYTSRSQKIIQKIL